MLLGMKICAALWLAVIAGGALFLLCCGILTCTRKCRVEGDDLGCMGLLCLVFSICVIVESVMWS